VYPQIAATLQEIKQGGELPLDKDGESAGDDEILDVSTFLIRIQGMKSSADHSPPIYSNNY